MVEAAALQTCELVTEVQFTAKEVIGATPVTVLLDFLPQKSSVKSRQTVRSMIQKMNHYGTGCALLPGHTSNVMLQSVNHRINYNPLFIILKEIIYIYSLSIIFKGRIVRIFKDFSG